MKSTPLEAIESEMEIIPKSRLISKPQNKKLWFNHLQKSPCKHLQKILKQLLTQFAKQKNCDDTNKLQLPSVNPHTFEVFTIDSLESIFPSNYRNRSKINISKTNTTNDEDYIEYIKILCNKKTMMIFSERSVLGNPGPTPSGVVIKKNGP